MADQLRDTGIVPEMNEQWIATADFIAVTPDGRRLPLRLRLAAPEQTTSEWECRISLAELYDDVMPMRGEDSLQALGLAWLLAGKLLRQFESTGGRIEFATGGLVPLEAYFGPMEP